ncbi:hypothetical protein Dimus_023510 [Dionaea muscipula]
MRRIFHGSRCHVSFNSFIIFCQLSWGNTSSLPRGVTLRLPSCGLLVPLSLRGHGRVSTLFSATQTHRPAPRDTRFRLSHHQYYHNHHHCRRPATMSCSILSPQAVAFATAMVAVSGTVILLAMRLQKYSPPQPQTQTQVLNPIPRPCISSGLPREKKMKKKTTTTTTKRVRFVEGLVDLDRTGRRVDDLKRQQLQQRQRLQVINGGGGGGNPSNSKKRSPGFGEMPANRVALYNSILRDRLVYRLAYTY